MSCFINVRLNVKSTLELVTNYNSQNTAQSTNMATQNREPRTMFTWLLITSSWIQLHSHGIKGLSSHSPIAKHTFCVFILVNTKPFYSWLSVWLWSRFWCSIFARDCPTSCCLYITWLLPGFWFCFWITYWICLPA